MMNTVVYAVLEAISSTDESQIVGLYTSYKEAKDQFTNILDADISIADEEKLLSGDENGCGEDFESVQEYRERAQAHIFS